MGNAAVAWVNLADAGVVSASSSIVLAPPRQLQDPHVARHWRSLTGTEFIVVDLGAAALVDTVAMLGLSLSPAGLTRVRASLTDPSGQDGAAYDSDPGGAVAGRVDYASLIHLLPAAVSARYVRVDLAEPGAPFLEAGRLFVGVRAQFGVNFDWDWGRGWVDRSRLTKGRGGQTFADVDSSYRTMELRFSSLTPSERWNVVEAIDRQNGQHTDVLLLTDPDSPNLGRDSVWGLLTSLDPVIRPKGWRNGQPVFTRSFKLEERL